MSILQSLESAADRLRVASGANRRVAVRVEYAILKDGMPDLQYHATVGDHAYENDAIYAAAPTVEACVENMLKRLKDIEQTKLLHVANLRAEAAKLGYTLTPTP